MEKINCLVVDDESMGRKLLEENVRQIPFLNLVGSCKNAFDAMEKLQGISVDLIFLDINLSDGTAFDFLEKIDSIDFKIIFITAYDEFAIQAIRYGATDYILKPVDVIDFVAAVTKALEAIKKSRSHITSTVAKSKINLPTMQGFKTIDIADIIRCEADANYTVFFMNNNTKMMVSRNLKEFENHLAENDFFRIHSKHLINLKHFREYIKGKGGQVIMSDYSVLDVSVRKKQEFMEVLQLWGVR